MVGVGTVLADDPLLNCRIENGKNPIRIICDTNLRTPVNSKVIETAAKIPTIIATACKDEAKRQPYLESACNIITTSNNHGHVDLTELMTKLGQQNIDSVLLEGGGTLCWSALQSGVVNKVQAYIAPKLIGGVNAKTPVMGIGAEHPDKAFVLANSKITVLGEDILIESEVVKNVYGNH
jgi:diaminohydroxyphosphoribosylaminopyrimidine deaminase/5-amino-6-(5-phosphoribosylamino)uracil reductase